MSGGNQLRPLPPVPTTTVTANSLPQPITFGQEPTIESQSLDDVAGTGPESRVDGAFDTATLEPAPLPQPPGGASEVTEDDLIGAWSATTPVATCSINLSLTTWQGGYRASTRNCADVQMAALTAWSIEGQQVLLRDTEGAPMGRLYRTGPTRYAGQMDSGDALTLFR
ncbi:AprI/Inh family metalloprotease inhibitor [Ahrensia marina]|uniref:AprI/Inh family metalloprotease inhibitor n=1 Tax=Ahrensia marina TaxID=1514904 RepID=UPI0035D0C95D